MRPGTVTGEVVARGSVRHSFDRATGGTRSSVRRYRRATAAAAGGAGRRPGRPAHAPRGAARPLGGVGGGGTAGAGVPDRGGRPGSVVARRTGRAGGDGRARSGVRGRLVVRPARPNWRCRVPRWRRRCRFSGWAWGRGSWPWWAAARLVPARPRGSAGGRCVRLRARPTTRFAGLPERLRAPARRQGGSTRRRDPARLVRQPPRPGVQDRSPLPGGCTSTWRGTGRRRGRPRRAVPRKRLPAS